MAFAMSLNTTTLRARVMNMIKRGNEVMGATTSTIPEGLQCNIGASLSLGTV